VALDREHLLKKMMHLATFDSQISHGAVELIT
jgi:hypothetical protein